MHNNKEKNYMTLRTSRNIEGEKMNEGGAYTSEMSAQFIGNCVVVRCSNNSMR